MATKSENCSCASSGKSRKRRASRLQPGVRWHFMGGEAHFHLLSPAFSPDHHIKMGDSRVFSTLSPIFPLQNTYFLHFLGDRSYFFPLSPTFCLWSMKFLGDTYLKQLPAPIWKWGDFISPLAEDSRFNCWFISVITLGCYNESVGTRDKFLV